MERMAWTEAGWGGGGGYSDFCLLHRLMLFISISCKCVLKQLYLTFFFLIFIVVYTWYIYIVDLNP